MLKRALSIGMHALCVRAYQLLRACRLCSYRVLELLSCRVDQSSLGLLGENSSPFIVEGDGFTSQRKRESVCIHMLPSLVAHTIGYGMAIGAHNTAYVQTHLAGSTMFVWYGK